VLLAVNKAGRIDPEHRRLTTSALYGILHHLRPASGRGQGPRRLPHPRPYVVRTNSDRPCQKIIAPAVIRAERL
jgi:hypothetical protein